MIYFTSWDCIKDLGELYSKWVGHTPKFKFGTFAFLIVAREKGSNKFVGATQLIIIDDQVWDRRWGLVENVFVSEPYRKQGIGKELMENVEAQAQLMGCKFIKLTSRKEEGKALYKSLGYEEGSSFRKDLC